MSKQAHGGVECTVDVPITPGVMQLVTFVLANSAGGGVPQSVDSSVPAVSPPTLGAVQGMLQLLSQREEQVVRLRYGIGTRVHSAHEISEQLGMMPHQIERIEVRVFRKLRETSLAGEMREGPARREPAAVSERRPALPEEPRRLPDDSDCEANPWDEV